MEYIANQPSVKDSRESNMELLRIVAMSMIIIHHFIVHVICLPDTHRLYNLIKPFFAGGVNLFFLLSGYFKIKMSFSGLLKLIVAIIIFRVFDLLISINFGGGDFSPGYLRAIFLFPITKSHYWFLQVYLGIMFLTPFLNGAIENIKIKQYRLAIILFTLFTVYSCNLGENMSNANGYTFCQGVYLYCLGHYIKKDKIILDKIKSIWLIINCIFIITIDSILYYVSDYQNLIFYSNIFIVFGFTFLFVYFTRIRINSKVINFIASGALGCYLLQDGWSGKSYYLWQNEFITTSSITYCILMFILSFLIFWTLSLPLTYISNKISSTIFRLIPLKYQFKF